MTDLILTEIAGGIATVTLNRPEAMNALSKALRHRLYEVMTALDADDGVRAVILTGAGTRAFTAGLDLKELGSQEGALGAANAEGADENPVKAIESCRKPVIGAINGVAITGGFEVALACDVLIASSNARFADTHARVGVVPGWGLSQKLSRMIGISRAKELSFTGNFLDAATAERWGLVNRVVAPESLLAEARRLAADMASVDPAFLAGYKRLIDEGYAASFGEGLAIEHRQSSAANSAVRPAELEARRAQRLEAPVDGEDAFLDGLVAEAHAPKLRVALGRVPQQLEHRLGARERRRLVDAELQRLAGHLRLGARRLPVEAPTAESVQDEPVPAPEAEEPALAASF